MQNTHLSTSFFSSESGTSSSDRSSSSPAIPETLNLPPSTTRIPLSPPRFISPLPYVDPASTRHLDSILRSFPTGADPAVIYTALKVHLGISRSKDPTSTSASPPLAGNTPTQEAPSPPGGRNMTSFPHGPSQPLEVVDIDNDDEIREF